MTTWQLKKKELILAIQEAKAECNVWESIMEEMEGTAEVTKRDAKARLLEVKADVLREEAMLVRANAKMPEKRAHKQEANTKILAAKTYLSSAMNILSSQSYQPFHTAHSNVLKYHIDIGHLKCSLDKLKRQERGEKKHAKKQKEVALQRAQEEKEKATAKEPIQYLTGTRLDTLPTWDIIHENIMPYLDIASRLNLNAVLPRVERGGWKRLSNPILSEQQQKQIISRKRTHRGGNWIKTYTYYEKYVLP
jgi:hypothetical protein